MAIWTRNHGDQSVVEVIAKDEQCLTKISDLLNGVMTKKTIDFDLESKEIFESTEWEDLVGKIQKDYPNLFLINLETEGKVIVTAVTELIDVVVPGIEDFICTNIIYTEAINFNRGQNYILENFMKKDTEQLIRKLGKSVKIDRTFRAISVKGRKQDVNKARSELAGHLERITETEMKFTDEHELRYFQSEEGFNATSRVNNGYIERSDRRLDECGRFMYEEKYIDVIAGDITQLDVDIIVCPTDTKLSNSGGLAHSIVQKGNGRIVEECQRIISNRRGSLQTGECVVTTAGNLPCKNVIHVILPGGSDPQTRSSDLTTVFMKVLEKVMAEGLTSVALPVLGSGAVNFSLQESVETIFKAVTEHFSRCAYTTIKQIYIVDMNEVNVAAVIDHLRGNPLFLEVQYSPRIMRRSPAEKVVNEVKVRITKGEIAKAKTDVIVNSTSTTLNLSSGAISGSILMAAGMKLQSECKKAYPKGINCGDVAITLAYGKLKCKMVLHACLKTYDDAKEKGLRDMILTCLRETEKYGLQSISFPAIGCGVLKYPPQTVAETFLKTVNEYVTKGGAIKAENIHIVLYPKDTEIIKTFEAVMSNPNSRTNTDSRKQNIEGKFTENDLKKGVKINDTNIKIVIGDILERGVTAIVHGTNAQLDFSKGQVSNRILKKEGKNLISQCKAKHSDMKATGIITTKTINMNCKTIIHVDQLRFSSDVKSGLASCMQVAEYNTFRSVAFPILFTGYGTSHEDFAKAMFKSLVDTNFQFLETIEIVIFHLDDYKRVVETLLRLIEECRATNEKQPSGGFLSTLSVILYGDGTSRPRPKIEKTWHSSSVDTSSFLSKPGPSSGENRSANTRSFHSTVGDREITFRIYSLGRNDEIEDYINKCYENATKHLEVPLTVDVDEQQIMAIMERIPVTIRLIPNLRKVVVFGFKEDVLHAQHAVHEINHFEVEKKGKEERNRIEQKQKKAAEINKAGIPINWTSHVQTGYEAVELDEDSEEYKKVANNFNSTLGVSNCSIVKIERIENPILYQQYLAKKDQLMSDLGNLKINVEREVLWHGCAEGSVESINKNGFNRNFCGKNATHFGNGVYFAVNSRYSAQSKYATPDSAGTRRMYQCRVLVGDAVQFDEKKHNKDKLPPNPDNGNRQHDSFVNDINNPVMFVIFHDSGAYPDYIISYRRN